MAKRDITKEKHFVRSRNGAKSSFNALYFHDIPPELIRRAAKRYTDGHKKYGVGTYNLNWRTGLDDIEYVMERFNHLWEHLLNFLEDGNDKDDNLGAIVWCCAFLMEVERLHPELLKQVIGQSKFEGKTAREFVEKFPKTR